MRSIRLDFTNSEDLRRISNLDKKLYNVIDKVEQNLAKIDEKEQLLVRALLLNLYRWGKYLFGWNYNFQYGKTSGVHTKKWERGNGYNF